MDLKHVSLQQIAILSLLFLIARIETGAQIVSGSQILIKISDDLVILLFIHAPQIFNQAEVQEVCHCFQEFQFAVDWVQLAVVVQGDELVYQGLLVVQMVSDYQQF